MATLCLAGPTAEQYFCGAITDGADLADYQMARRYLAPRFGPLRIGVELARCRDAADRLVRAPLARLRIEVIAAALLRHGTLDAAALAGLV